MGLRALVLLAVPAAAWGQTTISQIGTSTVNTGATLTRSVADLTNNYTINYNGIETRINTVVAAGVVYGTSTSGEVRVRRNTATETFPNGNANQTTPNFSTLLGGRALIRVSVSYPRFLFLVLPVGLEQFSEQMEQQGVTMRRSRF